jgi:flagellar basal body-associated protein FliL
MSDTAQATAVEDAATGVRRSMFGWKTLALAAVVVLAAAGGAYYYLVMMRPVPHGDQTVQQEPPLPFYLEVKPFVVSLANANGEPHFTQIGVNLTLSGARLGALVDAMAPEVTDTLRLAVLSFKVEDITSPAGVDKLRAKMIEALNKMLLQRLGAERIAAINNGSKVAIRNIYFSQLIIE